MVSVCIATYNGSKYIEEELRSILPQLNCDDEIIISDDGSSDNTIDIIRSFNDERIKIFVHKRTQVKYKFDYTTRNFENAIYNSKGDFIFLADQDDVWLPNKYSVMMDSLKENDIVISDCKIVDKDLNIICESKFKTSYPSNRIIPCLKGNKNIGCCMAFKRRIIDRVLPFPPYGVAQDWWLACYGNMYFKMAYINEPLMLYRRHETTVSATGGNSQHSIKDRIEIRLIFIYQLIKRGSIIRIIQNL